MSKVQKQNKVVQQTLENLMSHLISTAQWSWSIVISYTLCLVNLLVTKQILCRATSGLSTESSGYNEGVIQCRYLRSKANFITLI